MKQEAYDVVVIGAGSGGLTSAVGLAKIGKRVLLVEKEHLGGECTNSGCIPSKALLHHAKAYYEANKISGRTEQNETYRQEAFSYVRNVVSSVLADETPEHFEKLGITVVLGEAIFTSPNTLTVGEIEYPFKKAIIATGSSPRPLSLPGLRDDQLLTNKNLFALETIPTRTLIIGGGPIGMEMGQALAMLESTVTILDNGPEFARLEDKAIRPIITQRFTELGITIFTNATMERVSNGIADVRVGGNSVEHVVFDKVLIAVGRVPNIPTGLAAADVTHTEHGITVNKNWQTTNRHVYALGDVAASLKFTHAADDAARQVIAHIATFGLWRAREKLVPKVTYTDPEIGQVGLSWPEAVEQFGEENIFRLEVPLTANDRARTDGATAGLLVIVVKRLSGKILGAHLIGPRAGEIIGTLTLATENNLSLYRLRNTIFAYPTYSLILKRAGDYFLAQQFASLRNDLWCAVKPWLPKIFVASLWLWGLAELYTYQQTFALTPSELSLKIFNLITATAWAPLLYIMAYTIRPILFIPGTALTILSGIFFGFFGIVYTIIGANLSAAVAYLVGHFFSSAGRGTKKLLSRWVTYLHEHPFSAILMMRLTFFPFDLVAYGAGLLRVAFTPFLLATALGTLLGITTFVAIGASISVEEFAKNGISVDAINLNYIIISVTIFIVSHTVAEVVRRKKNLPQ
jgi:pyruvate/2-oxoglutarate dehydrogenase complex dihydrolipoamide dehydrogenase (E3) component/uncharacterized membrane protein YdjX (TVP38/TMEM64 family)